MLRAEGIPANVVNTPKAIKPPAEGCGYSVSFPSEFQEAAYGVLRRKGISASMKEY